MTHINKNENEEHINQMSPLAKNIKKTK